MSRPTRITIDLKALTDNAQALRKQAGSRKFMAVVKADAYGHGAAECAQALSEHVDAFAVAITEEALALRSAGIEHPILVLQGPHSADDLEAAVHASLWPAISNHDQLDWLKQSNAQFDKVWIKCDTGMHRLGFLPDSVATVRQTLASIGTHKTVLMSHLADAEHSESTVTQRQKRAWATIAHDATETSLSNSAGLLGRTVDSDTWLRLGYALYGGSVSEKSLKPVMTFSSKIASIRCIEPGGSVGYSGRWVAKRASKIATIPVGYADGYPRSARDGTPIGSPFGLIPLAGKVSMDMITADITDQPQLKVGSPVTLWGAIPSIDQVASHCDTIGYELLTRITQRVPKLFYRT
ncbi:MAG: alanine racemase [Luminiphilus sp.]|nr:alanine racemase [Luminiphilus sp.]